MGEEPFNSTGGGDFKENSQVIGQRQWGGAFQEPSHVIT